jgi:hypothetical protein
MNRLTLLDVAKQQDPDGTLAMIAEVLQQSNAILQDMPMLPSNAPMGHRVTMRSSLPTVAWGKINQGVSRSKSATTQAVDTIGIMVGLSEVDAKIKEIVGEANFSGARLNEDKAFLEAMSQSVAQTILYGNEETDESGFTGLQPRLTTAATAITGSYVKKHHSSPSGSDYTSIYIVDWGERGCHGVYPKNSSAGLKQDDMGKQRVLDADSNAFTAYVKEYTWMIGLSVADPRHVARLANIDISQALSDTSTMLMDSLVEIMNGMASRTGLQRVMYTRREILTALWKQVMNKGNMALTVQEYLNEPTLHVWGVPIRALDQMSAAESAIS